MIAKRASARLGVITGSGKALSGQQARMGKSLRMDSGNVHTVPYRT